MQSRKVDIASREGYVSGLQCIYIVFMILVYQLRKNWSSWQPIPCLDAQDEIASSASRAAVAIDERMNVVKSPQNKRGEHNRIGLFPNSICDVDKIIHQGLNSVKFWRTVRSHGDFAGPIFARIYMQASNRVKVQGL